MVLEDHLPKVENKNPEPKVVEKDEKDEKDEKARACQGVWGDLGCFW